MLDLGLTLVDANQRLFDHVREALTAIEGFRTADSKPLSSCLVSDFTIVAPPITPAKVRPVFEEYLAVLDAAGLREFFEPVSKRVTLSTHVGVNKPDRAVFIKALSRLQSRATLEECLFITENADHIRAARQTMGMTTLQFKSPEATRFDFDDWSQAPALIAHSNRFLSRCSASVRICMIGFPSFRTSEVKGAHCIPRNRVNLIGHRFDPGAMPP
jgi:HAD superfamily hydrolase (TIGR01509 family)